MATLPSKAVSVLEASRPGLQVWSGAHHEALVKAASWAVALDPVATVCLISSQLIRELGDAEVNEAGAAILSCVSYTSIHLLNLLMKPSICSASCTLQQWGR